MCNVMVGGTRIEDKLGNNVLQLSRVFVLELGVREKNGKKLGKRTEIFKHTEDVAFLFLEITLHYAMLYPSICFTLKV